MRISNTPLESFLKYPESKDGISDANNPYAFFAEKSKDLQLKPDKTNPHQPQIINQKEPQTLTPEINEYYEYIPHPKFPHDPTKKIPILRKDFKPVTYRR